jgi:hypothetical protein
MMGGLHDLAGLGFRGDLEHRFANQKPTGTRCFQAFHKKIGPAGEPRQNRVQFAARGLPRLTEKDSDLPAWRRASNVPLKAGGKTHERLFARDQRRSFGCRAAYSGQPSHYLYTPKILI